MSTTFLCLGILVVGLLLGGGVFLETIVLGIQSSWSSWGDSSRMTPIYQSLSSTMVDGITSPSFPLKGKNCFVTGTSRGLGKSIASELISLGCHVYLGQRSGDPQKTAEELILDSFAKSSHIASVSVSDYGSAELWPLDLSDLSSIEKCVERFLKHEILLDVVIFNAAVVPSETRLTKDGFEESFGVNYLGHFHLSQLLLSSSIIRQDGSWPSRVIFVISEMHRMANPLKEEDIGCVKEYGMAGSLERYAHSKICLATYAVEFSSRLEQQQQQNIDIFLYDPGPVNTDIARSAPSWLQVPLSFLMDWTFKTPEESALPVGYLSIAPNIPKTHYLLYWTNATLATEAWKESEREYLFQK
eukprot:CAMPEP_0201477562 /NCGR_PEP_ID=MMETSP0151_2-20130828/2559_1 /ASSEMBLY_ACC=CAM_ASM_000257 /TAXON_ID=200890 /ORGANISM="Paramoeba atlantica, Strain 621/1 / CCAP 1560/9" /LENGTH=357 /DNA_ID=CAMNT_0047858325 /DNA_START=115 /DNA_END=1185 /DNA_ORIENTATION=-